jgi:DNA polymerase III gamma/tau subunit
MMDLKDFVGNSTLKKAISAIFQRDKIELQTYLFHGASGCGKSALGNIFAQTLGKEKINCRVYNSAADRGIDMVRKIIETAQCAPFGDGYKILIFEEAHKITGTAKEALLDFLEKPPKHVILIFTTTEPGKFLKGTALKRRFFIGEVKAVTDKQMFSYLTKTLHLNEKWSSDLINQIVKKAEGSIGHVLQIVDSVYDLDEETASDFIKGEIFTKVDADIKTLCHALLSGKKWFEVAEIIKNLKSDGESSRYSIKGYLGAMLLNNFGNFDQDLIYDMLQEFLPSFINSGKEGLVAACYACKFIYEEN